MTGLRRRLGGRVRVLAALLPGAAVAAVGIGCQSMRAPPEPPPPAYTALYPGLKTSLAPPVSLADANPSGVVAAAFTAVAPKPVAPKPPASAPAAVPPGGECVLDLGVALRLAGVDNPTINLTRERVREARASELAARSLLLPSVNVGGNYRAHRGPLQSGTGLIRSVDGDGLYLGAGAGAVGAGTVAVPGVRLFAHLGDAAYEPLAARQRTTAARFEAVAVRNAILRDVAVAYLELVGAEARLAAVRRGETELGEVVRRAAAYAETGQGRAGDANRAAANAALLAADVRRGEEDAAVASARLCRLLSLDPAVRLRSPDGPVEAVRLIPADADVEALVAGAVGSRPEVFARAAEVMEAQARVRQERARPWLPVVSVGYSAGGFGGGSDLVDTRFGPLTGRSDFDVAAVWTLGNLGAGNRMRVRRADARVGVAAAEYDRAVNVVRREVRVAHTDSAAAVRQMDAARAAVAAAEEGFRLDSERVRQGQGLPLEVLDSFRQSLAARTDLIRAVVAFDAAQFRLWAAVGNDPAAGVP